MMTGIRRCVAIRFRLKRDGQIVEVGNGAAHEQFAHLADGYILGYRGGSPIDEMDQCSNHIARPELGSGEWKAFCFEP